MQNAQNLMSSFEFIAALMSIIIGLGVTNLLTLSSPSRLCCCWYCNGG